MKSPTEVRDLLKRIQETYGYSLAVIAEKIGVTEAALSRWNNGKVNPKHSNLIKLRSMAEGKLDQASSGGVDSSRLEGRIDVLSMQISKLEGKIETLIQMGMESKKKHA
jgi:transcriptional regulator with XRE-family HTH domain